jgi:nucleoside permease NupC
MTEVLRGVLGLAVLMAIGIALSQNRGAIRPRVVMSALGLQVAIGVLMLIVRPGRMALEASGSAINQVIAYRNNGMEFMFGGLVGPRMHEVSLCGFANFSSIAILAGGFGAVAPELRAPIARYGLRVVAAASLSNLASATIAGALLS